MVRVPSISIYPGMFGLRGKEPYKITSEEEMEEWFKNKWSKDENGRELSRVAKDILPDGRVVSTVFLGIDHGFGTGSPILFETMVFPSEEDFAEIECHRYETWDEAEKKHREIVDNLSKV